MAKVILFMNDYVIYDLWARMFHAVLGIPELNVPSLEPLVMKELVAAEGNGLKITTENLKVYGCSNFTIQSLEWVEFSCSWE